MKTARVAGRGELTRIRAMSKAQVSSPIRELSDAVPGKPVLSLHHGLDLGAYFVHSPLRLHAAAVIGIEGN